MAILSYRLNPRAAARDRRAMFMSSQSALTQSGANATIPELASASRVNLNYATGEIVEITGTTGITEFVPGTQANEKRELRFMATLTLTHDANKLVLPGEANIVTRAGDFATIVYRGNDVWEVTKYTRGGLRPSVGTIQNANVRLTPTSGVPVTVADASGDILYATPYRGNIMPVWDGSVWQAVEFSELSIPRTQTQSATITNGSPIMTGLTDTSQLWRGMLIPAGSGIPAGGANIASIPSATSVVMTVNATADNTMNRTFQASQATDIFCLEVGGVLVLRAAEWTSATARAHAISFNGPFYTNTNNIDTDDFHGGIPAGYGLLLGTTAMNVAVQCAEARRNIWNMFNRVQKTVRCVEDTDSWTYSTNAYRSSNGAGAGKASVFLVRGLDEDVMELTAISRVTEAGATLRDVAVGIGIGSTTVNSATLFDSSRVASGNQLGLLKAFYRGNPAIGSRGYFWLERGSGAGTQTWYGDTSPSNHEAQYGMTGLVWC